MTPKEALQQFNESLKSLDEAKERSHKAHLHHDDCQKELIETIHAAESRPFSLSSDIPMVIIDDHVVCYTDDGICRSVSVRKVDVLGE